MKKETTIPAHVIDWTDKYFHQSTFDMPVRYPSKMVKFYLLQFKKPKQAMLYRGINKYNEGNNLITSWTYDKQVASRYAQGTKGLVIKRKFSANKILLDTTMLTEVERRQLGYDYNIDDKEVLILNT